MMMVLLMVALAMVVVVMTEVKVAIRSGDVNGDVGDKTSGRGLFFFMLAPVIMMVAAMAMKVVSGVGSDNDESDGGFEDVGKHHWTKIKASLRNGHWWQSERQLIWRRWQCR